MRKFSLINILAIITILLLLLLLGFYYFDLGKNFRKSGPTINEQQAALEHVDQLLAQSKPEEALVIIREYADQMNAKSPTSEQWLQVLLRASTDSRDVFQLMYLNQNYPDAFKGNEKASLLAADGYILMSKSQEYQNLRKSWLNQGTEETRWFVLDADNLVIQGKPQEAISMLKSRTFEGKADTGRLIRLALLNINEQPKLAWEYLTEAYKKNPDNPDIRTYRARLLEAVGKNQYALTEYLAAIESAPKNLFLKDQLAEFYQRQKEYYPMMQVWVDTLAENANDRIWLKTIFWNRVITPIKFDWTSVKQPEGHLKPLVDFLLALPPGQYWSQTAFEKHADLQQLLKTEQATFWLRLIQTLKENNETEALNLLQYNPFAHESWDPELEDNLKKILVYRKTGSLSMGDGVGSEDYDSDMAHTKAMQGRVQNNHPLFLQLKDFSKKKEAGLPSIQLLEEIHELLLSDEAFSSVFIASGWLEAGLQLHRLKVIPNNFPDWVSYDITQGIRANRTNLDALQFATLQKKSPPLQLLIGEMMIATGSPDAGLAELQKLSKESSEPGIQATWLIALINIDQGKYEEAKKMISGSSTLSNQVRGKEILARIALLQGDLPLADKIYSSLESSSVEAKSYLARKAFAEKNWTKAHELTEQLIRQYPTNELLRQNMQKIIEEEGESKTIGKNDQK